MIVRKKFVKIIIVLIFLILVSFHFLNYVYLPRFKNDFGYLRYFKDSIHFKIDTANYCIYKSKLGKIAFYHYYDDVNNMNPYPELDDTTTSNKYNFTIWEFDKNYYFNDVKLSTSIGHYKSDLIFSNKIGSYNPIVIQNFKKFNGMRIYPFLGSKIIQTYNDKNFKGFYGRLNGILICDKNDQPNSYIDFMNENTPTIVLVYNLHDKLCLTWIHATKKLDASIINTLNFD